MIESAYYSIPYLSWMHVTFGDPLYKPFRRSYDLSLQPGLAVHEEKKGLDWMYEKNWEKAFTQFEHVKLLYRNAGDLKGEVRQWFHQASIYRQTQKKKQAIALLEDAKQRFAVEYSANAFDVWLNKLNPPQPKPQPNTKPKP